MSDNWTWRNVATQSIPRQSVEELKFYCIGYSAIISFNIFKYDAKHSIF